MGQAKALATPGTSEPRRRHTRTSTCAACRAPTPQLHFVEHNSYTTTTKIMFKRLFGEVSNMQLCEILLD